MTITLPEYSPPNDQRVSLAVGAGPLLVLLGFTLLVVRLIDVDTGLALFAAATVWAVHETHVYQRTLDAYNHDYVRRHLAWRSTEALSAMAEAPGASPGTRAFVAEFLREGVQPLVARARL